MHPIPHLRELLVWDTMGMLRMKKRVQQLDLRDDAVLLRHEFGQACAWTEADQGPQL